MGKRNFFLVILLFSWVPMASLGQRISSGLAVLINNNFSMMPEMVYSPNSNTILTWPHAEKKPVYVGVGQYWAFNVTLEYRRLLAMVNVGIGTNQSDKYTFLNPNGKKIENKVETSMINNQALLGVRVTNGYRGIILVGGVGASTCWYINNSYVSDLSFSGEYPLYGIVYNNNRSYLSGIGGFAYKWKNVSWMVLLSTRLGKEENHPIAQTYSLSVGGVSTVRFQRLRKGHKFYIEE
jgi:hypothetical protein